MKCPNCEKEAEFQHLIREAHGIPGTYMAGSERYKCPNCSKSFYRSEGEKYGFVYYRFDR